MSNLTVKESLTVRPPDGASLAPVGGSASARPPADRSPAYWAWRDKLAADPTTWKFTDREEAIAFAAFIAGWYLRTGQADCHSSPNSSSELTAPQTLKQK